MEYFENKVFDSQGSDFGGWESLSASTLGARARRTGHAAHFTAIYISSIMVALGIIMAFVV